MPVKTLFCIIIISLSLLTNFNMGFCQTKVRLVPKPVEETSLIKAEIHQCVQAIRSQKITYFKHLLSENFNDINAAIRSKEQALNKIKQVFEDKKSRISDPEFKKRSPRSLADNPMWDFDINVLQVDISDGTATVKCELLWHTLQRNMLNGNSHAMASEILIFEQEFHRWKLKESKQFLKFLAN